MAVVNIDLSEYDAIRKRNSELEEQVKELKKLNESLKGGSKVILRKETVLEHETDVPGYGPAGLPTYKRRESRDVIESTTTKEEPTRSRSTARPLLQQLPHLPREADMGSGEVTYMWSMTLRAQWQTC